MSGETQQPTQAEPAVAKTTTSKKPLNWGTGRRREAVARVRLVPGTGKIMVNKRELDSYFPRESDRIAVRSPLLLVEENSVDVHANVGGGGLSGQSGAILMGIARALSTTSEVHRLALRKAGMLTRDPRMKERKKYGQKGARKRFQWTKR